MYVPKTEQVKTNWQLRRCCQELLQGRWDQETIKALYSLSHFILLSYKTAHDKGSYQSVAHNNSPRSNQDNNNSMQLVTGHFWNICVIRLLYHFDAGPYSSFVWRLWHLNSGQLMTMCALLDAAVFMLFRKNGVNVSVVSVRILIVWWLFTGFFTACWTVTVSLKDRKILRQQPHEMVR